MGEVVKRGAVWGRWLTEGGMGEVVKRGAVWERWLGWQTVI